MALKKSELYASLWNSCDELRGGMDASQYKDYVLVLLFMKYVSDKAASRPDYDLIVPAGGSFADMVALKGKADIGEGINKVITKLAEANDTLRGAIDVADFNDDDKLGKGQEKVDRLSNLVGIFESPSLDFRGNSAEGDDLLGDAYEYLMRNFATESGKSKGQFYTPAEVSRIMSAVVGVTKATSRDQSIYDPTCGSGSLLLKAHDAAKSATGFDLAIYGQEMDNATAALARMNMVLHDATTAEIWQDNTLAHPYFRAGDGGLKTFDFVVANPPFSSKTWTTGFDPINDEFGRFPYGQPPTKNGDYAFLLHMLTSLKSTGRAAVILPHGVLFRGNQEGPIRRELLRRGFIEAIIGLPANLFYGTNISACIIVIDKAGSSTRDAVFMVDASRGFVKDGNKNRLRERDIHRILDAFTRRHESAHYSRLVPLATIAANDFNLAMPRYIDSGEREDVHDLTGHLIGALPDADIDALAHYWDVLPGLRELLVGPSSRTGYCALRSAAPMVQATIEEHPEVQSLRDRAHERFTAWTETAREALDAFTKGDKPKVLGRSLGEEILRRFGGLDLIDPYAIYQRYMDYWASTLQDDLYLLTAEDWQTAAQPREIVDVKGQKTRPVPDFTIGKARFKSDLLPVGVLIAARFPEMRDDVIRLEAEASVLEQAVTDIVEAHTEEGGALEEFEDDAGKISVPEIRRRLRESAIPEDEPERAILRSYLEAGAAAADAKSQIRAARQTMNERVVSVYRDLSTAEIKDLVINHKWLADIGRDVEDEVQAVTLRLAARLRHLGSRYGDSLPALEGEAQRAAATMDAHFRSIGLTW